MADVTIQSTADVGGGSGQVSAKPLGMSMNPLASSGLDLISNIATSAMNVHEMRSNRRFQRDMANTAHQREVKDLIAAGLNPILSANHQGAVTPSGGAAQVMAPSPGRSYNESRQVQAALGLTAAQTEQAHAAASLSSAQAMDVIATRSDRYKQVAAELENMYRHGDLTDADRLRVNAQREEIQKKIQMMDLEMPALRRQSEFQSGWGGKISPYVRLFGDVLGTGTSALGGAAALKYLRGSSEEHESEVRSTNDDGSEQIERIKHRRR